MKESFTDFEETQLFEPELMGTKGNFNDLSISDTELSEEEFSGVGIGEFKATDFNMYND